jgi:2-keto-4-pentenoate hydratase/2-oxohepta-3-ene-1,7-dioic acid hydratase in catechol pathway
MQLVTLKQHGGHGAGIVMGAEILDLAGARDAVTAAHVVPRTVRGIIEGGPDALDAARRVFDRVASGHLADRLRDSGALVARAQAKLLAPIPDPNFILSCGMNYHEHLKEMNSQPPAWPVAFVKSNAAIIGPGAPIVLPKSNPNMVDWEGEFCVVMGRACHDVSEAEALDCVAGYTLVNDVSTRDWVTPIAEASGVMAGVAAWDRNILGKQFPTFCPMGPVIVTKDELPDPHAVKLQTLLNGKVMQSANTDDLVFNVPTLIAYYSKFYRFLPGDVITTGSPSGVGFGRKPPVFMRPGDTIEVHGAGIGVLSNPVVGHS